MKKIGLVIALVVAVGLVCSTMATPASAFFPFGSGGPFGSFWGGAKAGCGSGCGYAMPYYGWYGCAPVYKCKVAKKKGKGAAKPAPAKKGKK